VVGEKAKSAFDKVKVGDRVRLNYSEEGSKLVILSLAENKSGSDNKASK
jgi:ribosomal 50S subunit-recycling heat shock protein